MRIGCREKPAWMAAGFRFILPGLITLLLLPAPAGGKSACPPGVLPTSHQGESEVRRVHLSFPNLRSTAPGRENLGKEFLKKPSPRQDHPADLGKRADYQAFRASSPRICLNLAVEPAAWAGGSPLAGVRLPMQANLRASGDSADPGDYGYRRLAGICRRGGKTGLAADGKKPLVRQFLAAKHLAWAISRDLQNQVGGSRKL
jgi:hypothetical protein